MSAEPEETKIVEAEVGIEISEDNHGFEQKRDAIAEELDIHPHHITAVEDM